MQHVRPTPFDLVFEPIAQRTFPQIRKALAENRQDPRDRDGFMMLRDVITLLRDLRPEEGLGEGIGQLTAFVHHAYLYWEGGRQTVELPAERLRDLVGEQPEYGAAVAGEFAFYTQLPERQIWAQVIAGEAHEPLDGYFQYAAPEDESLRVLGVFGMHPERPGVSVVEVSGPKPIALARADDTALFAPILPGGAAAGLFSLAGEEELLELAWRGRGMALPSEVSRWRV
jgi:hypothetical protein